MADGLQDAVCWALEHLHWFDPAKGKLTTWLILTVRSVWNNARFKGHRRGTVTAPRVTYPGDEAMPVIVDLCDPESILIAREINLAEEGHKLTRSPTSQLTREQVLAIRASDKRNKVLAAEYGVSRSIISDVQRGRTYKNVT